MFKAGNIIYFTPFYFKNGNPAKPKYFVVLADTGNGAVLASLPTRKDSIPKANEVDRGCVEIPDINMNCYVIPPNQPVTRCNKCFDFPTHIYGYQLDTFKLSWLHDIYRIEGVDYEIFGQMQKHLFDDLINCLRTSRSVKKKFIRMLR